MKPWLYLPVSWAHNLSGTYLKYYGRLRKPSIDQWNSVQWRGLTFPNPLGIAGGVDKSGESAQGWWALGAGFLEIGTITPKPQLPNPGRIMDRDIENLALWNKMGFPNQGAEQARRVLKALPRPRPTPVLVNVGKNRTTPNESAADDYVAVMLLLHNQADIFVVNISSPNTQGLRSLQNDNYFNHFLKQVITRYREQKGAAAKPVLIKISPDLSDNELQSVLKTSLKHNIDGWILTNTTLGRYPQCPFPNEGGVSGVPLAQTSKDMLKRAISYLGDQRQGRLVISVGGVFTPNDVKERLSLGADLVQVYSALVFHGPSFFKDVGHDFVTEVG